LKRFDGGVQVKRVLCCLILPLCVFVGVARAQEPKQSVIFDVRVIDLDVGDAASVETFVKDKAGLDRLIGEGKARIEASLHLRTRVGEQAQARIGQRVPVQVASVAVPGPPPRGNEGSVVISGPAQIQYENTGINLDVMPTKVMGDQIEARFRLELSSVDSSTSTLTPSFVTRTLSDIIQVRVGEPAVLLGVAQPGQRAAARPTSAAGHSQSNFAVLITAQLSN
jgi:hypothetical protein